MSDIQAYDVQTFAKAYGISRAQIYVEIKSGRLRIFKVGKRTLISRESATAWRQALTVWSEGLANMMNKPTEAWVGKWVSVTGLIEPPYNGHHYGKKYMHVGMTLTADGQVQFITEADARYRLGGSPPMGSASGNEDILRKLGGGSAKRGNGRPSQPTTVRPTPMPSRPTPQPLTGNRAILAGIKRSSGAPTHTTQYTSPTQTTPKRKREIPGWAWTVGMIALLIFLYYVYGGH